jgi:hypothetical protein
VEGAYLALLCVHHPPRLLQLPLQHRILQCALRLLHHVHSLKEDGKGGWEGRMGGGKDGRRGGWEGGRGGGKGRGGGEGECTILHMIVH